MLYAIRLVLSNLFGQEDAFIEIQEHRNVPVGNPNPALLMSTFSVPVEDSVARKTCVEKSVQGPDILHGD